MNGDFTDYSNNGNKATSIQTKIAHNKHTCDVGLNIDLSLAEGPEGHTKYN